MLDAHTLHCPHCGETFQTLVDPGYGDSDYIEDCPVCCRPIQLHLRLDEEGGVASLDADRDD